MKDKALLLEALKGGHVYVAQEYFRPAKGFRLSVKEGNREATMGDIFLLDRKALLSVKVPTIGHIRVVKDGSLFYEEIGQSASCSICQPGVYRIEVFAKMLRKVPTLDLFKSRLCKSVTDLIRMLQGIIPASGR